MNRLIVPVLPLIFHSAAASLSVAEPPTAIAALRTAVVNVSAMKEGGWNVEVREAKTLNETAWKQIETLPDVRRFSANGEQFEDAALARLAKIGGIETLIFNGPGITDADLAKLKAGLPGVEVDIKNSAGEDRLKQFNERVEQLRPGK